MNEALQMASAVRTFRQLRIRELLDLLRAPMALLAFVFVKGHRYVFLVSVIREL